MTRAKFSTMEFTRGPTVTIAIDDHDDDIDRQEKRITTTKTTMTDRPTAAVA